MSNLLQSDLILLVRLGSKLPEEYWGEAIASLLDSASETAPHILGQIAKFPYKLGTRQRVVWVKGVLDWCRRKLNGTDIDMRVDTPRREAAAKWFSKSSEEQVEMLGRPGNVEYSASVLPSILRIGTVPGIGVEVSEEDVDEEEQLLLPAQTSNEIALSDEEMLQRELELVFPLMERKHHSAPPVDHQYFDGVRSLPKFTLSTLWVESVAMLLWSSGFVEEGQLTCFISSKENLIELKRGRNRDSATSPEKEIELARKVQPRTAAVRRLAFLVETIPKELMPLAQNAADQIIRELWDMPMLSSGSDADPIMAMRELATLMRAESEGATVAILERQAFAPSYADAGWRLARIAKLAKGQRENLVHEAERRFVAVLPGEHKDRALAALIEVVEPTRLGKLLINYQKTADDEDLAKVRFSVVPHLGVNEILQDLASEGPTAQLRSLSRMMQVLVPTLELYQMKSFVVAASALASEWWIVEALTEASQRKKCRGASIR